MFNSRGFTLIETLIALVIAAVAAAVILSHTRTLMLRAERAHSHQFDVLQVLNDSLRLAHSGVPATSLQPRQEIDYLVLEGNEFTQRNLPPVRVSNFSINGEPVPPIAFAYTHFQTFAVSRDRYSVAMIYPSLSPPVDLSAAVSLPDNLNAALPVSAAGITAQAGSGVAEIATQAGSGVTETR